MNVRRRIDELLRDPDGTPPEEYEQLGVVMKHRPSLMEEGVETLKRAWTGEPFEYQGRTVRVLPRPAQRPRPLIAMGGASPASARRAALIADDYQPLSPKLYQLYLDELAALGGGAAIQRLLLDRAIGHAGRHRHGK